MMNKSFKLKHVFLTSLLALGVSACSMPNMTATQKAAQMSKPIHAGEILSVMHAVNNGEIKQAGVALQRSNDPHVLYLAQLLVQDHMASNQRLAALAKSTGTSMDESVLSQGMRTQAQEVMERVAQLSGKEFDCTFLQKQVEQHALTLKTIQEHLLPSATQTEVKDLLVMAAPRLEHHMKMAQDYHIGLQCPRT